MHYLTGLLFLQVEIVGNNACSRWHQDYYIGRALITYVGPGTWMVDDESVQFNQFKATAGAPTDVSDVAIVPNHKNIHKVPRNAIALIKGN